MVLVLLVSVSLFSAGFQGKSGFSFGRSGFSFWFQFLPKRGVGVFLPPLSLYNFFYISRSLPSDNKISDNKIRKMS